MVAGGVVAYDGKDTIIEDPSIATFKFYQKIYNSSDPDVDFGFHEIPSRYCVDSDFNNYGNNTDSHFYQTSSISVSDVQTYSGRFRCPLDLNDITVKGNFDSAAASNFMFVLEKCNNETSNVTCKSPEEIEAWMKWKYFIVVQN